jgi:hypothetical protein
MTDTPKPCPKCGAEMPNDLTDYILWRCKCGYVTAIHEEKVKQ